MPNTSISPVVRKEQVNALFRRLAAGQRGDPAPGATAVQDGQLGGLRSAGGRRPGLRGGGAIAAAGRSACRYHAHRGAAAGRRGRRACIDPCHGCIGLGGQAGNVVEELVGAVPQAITTVAADLPPGFPQDVADAVLGGLRRSAERLGQRV